MLGGWRRTNKNISSKLVSSIPVDSPLPECVSLVLLLLHLMWEERFLLLTKNQIVDVVEMLVWLLS